MKGAYLVRGATALLAGLAAGYALFTFGVAVLRVSGSSMEPALHDGALVLVVRPGLDGWLTGSTGPRSGDVVVVTVPGSAQRVVKRVAATAGHTVGMQDGVVLVDGAPAAAVAVPVSFAGHHDLATQTVPSHHVFVLGDNRMPLASRDSRDFGPVEVSALRGRVVLPGTGL